MNKANLSQQLFNDIKDNISYDSDITALKSLLFIMLELNIENSFQNWQYVIENYDITSLKYDLDFTPIIKDYPIKLIAKVGIDKFFLYMSNISSTKQRVIYDSIFNIYNPNCFVYQALSNYIKKNNSELEITFVKCILSKSSTFSKIIFDKTEFIRKIILLHLEFNNIPLPFLKELINEVTSKKDQAVLKTLLIDYLLI